MALRIEHVELAHGLVAELHCRESASPQPPPRALPAQKSRRTAAPPDPYRCTQAPPPAPRTGVLERDTYYAD